MNSAEIRALQALRAPGGIDTAQAGERWPSGGGTNALYALVRRGFAEKIDDTFFITEAGRAACPFRKPLAGKPANPPEVKSMPRARVTTQAAVLATIAAAGAAGITRAALFDQTDATHKAIANHLVRLLSSGAIQRPERGLYVATDLKTAQETPSTATVESCVQQTAKSETQAALTATGDTQSNVEGTPRIAYDWVKGPVTHDIHGTSLDVHHHEAADLPPVSLAQQMAQIGGFIPTIVEDINVADPKDVEFAIYSSGSMDMHFTDLSVTLQPPVLDKLRGFLGLFQEAV